MNEIPCQQSEFQVAVLEGLARRQKAVPPKFFYDREGSVLFDRICDCPEYYIARTEMAILREEAAQIAGLVGDCPVILELGSGASRKTRILLDAIPRARVYVPIDISEDILVESARKLRISYPQLRVLPLCADFTASVNVPRQELETHQGRRMVFFPGSTLGNYDPVDACALLSRVADLVEPGGLLLLGVDLVKPARILNAAYNDAQGVTAAFNLNLLRRMQTELGAQLDFGAFSHHAFFDEAKGRVEMHLISRRKQVVRILDAEFRFDEGESIHTENSYKYSRQGFSELASRAGLQELACWFDPRRLYMVALFENVSNGEMAWSASTYQGKLRLDSEFNTTKH